MYFKVLNVLTLPKVQYKYSTYLHMAFKYADFHLLLMMAEKFNYWTCT